MATACCACVLDVSRSAITTCAASVTLCCALRASSHGTSRCSRTSHSTTDGWLVLGSAGHLVVVVEWDDLLESNAIGRETGGTEAVGSASSWRSKATFLCDVRGRLACRRTRSPPFSLPPASSTSARGPVVCNPMARFDVRVDRRRCVRHGSGQVHSAMTFASCPADVDSLSAKARIGD